MKNKEGQTRTGDDADGLVTNAWGIYNPRLRRREESGIVPFILRIARDIPFVFGT